MEVGILTETQVLLMVNEIQLYFFFKHRLTRGHNGTFAVLFRVCAVQVIDGVHRVQFNLSHVFITDGYKC